MKQENGKFAGHDGIKLYWQSWGPDDTAKSVLLLVHGHGEHSGRYPYMVNRMVAKGIVVFAYDHRGHGKSPGRRSRPDWTLKQKT